MVPEDDRALSQFILLAGIQAIVVASAVVHERQEMRRRERHAKLSLGLPDLGRRGPVS
jgi:hypothetical protein